MASINQTLFFLHFYTIADEDYHIFSSKETIAEEDYLIFSAIVFKAGENTFLSSALVLSFLFFNNSFFF